MLGDRRERAHGASSRRSCARSPRRWPLHGSDASVADVLVELARRLEQRLAAPTGEILAAWRERDALRGERIRWDGGRAPLRAWTTSGALRGGDWTDGPHVAAGRGRGAPRSAEALGRVSSACRPRHGVLLLGASPSCAAARPRLRPDLAAAVGERRSRWAACASPGPSDRPAVAPRSAARAAASVLLWSPSARRRVGRARCSPAAAASRPRPSPRRLRRRPRRRRPFGKLRSSSRASARRLARHPRARPAQHLLGLGRVRQRGGEQRGAAAAGPACARPAPAGARCARARRPTSSRAGPSRRLVSGQRCTAYSSCTSRVYSARRQSHAVAWSRRPIERSASAWSSTFTPSRRSSRDQPPTISTASSNASASRAGGDLLERADAQLRVAVALEAGDHEAPAQLAGRVEVQHRLRAAPVVRRHARAGERGPHVLLAARTGARRRSATARARRPPRAGRDRASPAARGARRAGAARGRGAPGRRRSRRRGRRRGRAASAASRPGRRASCAGWTKSTTMPASLPGWRRVTRPTRCW